MVEQGLVGGILGGAGELGQEVALLEVELAQVGHGGRIGQRVRPVRKQRLHLRFGFDVRFLAGEPEALGVVQIAAGADGEQHIVRLGILPPEIVRVVGGDHADAELLAQAQHPLGDQPFLRDPVLLDLEPEPVRSEGPAEPLRAPPGLLEPSLPEMERHLSREARGQADDPLGVGREHFPVDPGAAIESLDEADRGEPDQVPVAGAILGQQDEVAVGRGRSRRLLPGGPGAEGQVRLEAEDRPDLLRLGVLVEGPRRVHVAVVGDGQAVHAELLDVRDELGDPVGPVEQRVFAVGVEMDEGHLFPELLAMGYWLFRSLPQPIAHSQ